MIEDKLCVMVCDVYKEEVSSVLDAGEFPDLELITYPHVCVKIPREKEKLENILDRCHNTYKYVISLYDQCDYIFKDVNTTPKLNGIARIYQCLELIASRDLLNYLQSSRNSYIVTPGWLRTWKQHINYWKFDRDTARQFFQESISQIVLLDTGIYTDSYDRLKDFADFVGMTYDSVEIGLDNIRYRIKNLYNTWHIARDNSARESQLMELNREISNYKMMCQISGTLGKLEDEAKVIETAVDFIKILIGAQRIIYFPVVDNVIKKPVNGVTVSKSEQETTNQFFKSDTDYAWHSSDTGFVVRLRYISETLGLLYIKGTLFKERLPDYLNLVLAITNPLSLSVSNARYYSRLQEAQEQLTILATTDSLTGILNRRTIIQRLETEIIRAGRQNKPLSIAMMDIDYFKKVNDTYGHAAGDRVLVGVVEQARSSLRPYDYIGRFGGEEFLMVIPGADKVDARGICERILSRIESLVVNHDNHEINVTVSLGVSTLPDSANCDADNLISNADSALYRAKNTGRNRAVHFDTAENDSEK